MHSVKRLEPSSEPDGDKTIAKHYPPAELSWLSVMLEKETSVRKGITKFEWDRSIVLVKLNMRT
jgi:hypothetical protein